jgi:hypothetical protein
MKKSAILLLAIIAGALYLASQNTAESKRFRQTFSEIKPQSFRADAAGVSAEVRSFAPAQPDTDKSNKKTAEEKTRFVPNKEPFRKQMRDAVHDGDSALVQFSAASMPPTALSFNGISSNDNAAAYGFRVLPPDPTGDVGLNHYVLRGSQ